MSKIPLEEAPGLGSPLSTPVPTASTPGGAQVRPRKSHRHLAPGPVCAGGRLGAGQGEGLCGGISRRLLTQTPVWRSPQVNVYVLGKTFLLLARELCINAPAIGRQAAPRVPRRGAVGEAGSSAVTVISDVKPKC